MSGIWDAWAHKGVFSKRMKLVNIYRGNWTPYAAHTRKYVNTSHLVDQVHVSNVSLTLVPNGLLSAHAHFKRIEHQHFRNSLMLRIFKNIDWHAVKLQQFVQPVRGETALCWLYPPSNLEFRCSLIPMNLYTLSEKKVQHLSTCLVATALINIMIPIHYPAVYIVAYKL